MYFFKLYKFSERLILNSKIKYYQKYLKNELVFRPQGEGGLTIDGPCENFSFGQKSHLKSNTYIDTRGGVSIGDNFHVGRSLTIYSSDHEWKDADLLPYNIDRLLKPVKIGNYVWIGSNVTILPGTVIEDGVVIGSCSVVKGILEKGGVYVGVPAKKINQRNLQKMDELIKQKKFF